MQKILVITAIIALLILAGCAGEKPPEPKPMGQIPQIEIVVPGELPEKPEYEPPPSEPEEEEAQ